MDQTPSGALARENYVTENADSSKIQVSVSCGQAVDNYTYFGIHPNAAVGWDEYDRYEPPGVGDYVMAYFSHLDWNENASLYAADIQPLNNEYNTWELEIQTNLKNKDVKVVFNNIEAIPLDYSAFLIDQNLKFQTNLRETNSLHYNSFECKVNKKYTIVLGKQGIIEQEVLDEFKLPDKFTLFQNFPNPFRETTIVNYYLPHPAYISLDIYDILGRLVKKLIECQYQFSGNYLIEWDGKNGNSIKVTHGIYYLILNINNLKFF